MIAFSRILLLAGLLAGCAAVGRPDENAPAASVSATAPIWREDLGDPVLRNLVAQADLQSLDVAMAVKRLERARAEAGMAAAEAAPHAEIDALGAVGAASRGGTRSRGSPQMSLTYEVDLWGRLAATARAGAADRDAAVEDLAAARLLVGFEVAQAYLAWRNDQTAHTLVRTQLDGAEAQMRLVRMRLAEGVADTDAVAAATATRDSLSSALSGLDADLTVDAAKLAALLGRTAAPVLPLASMTTPQPPAGAVSSEDADARPEVAAAWRRFQAADARRAEAVAASRPRFVLGLSLGSADPNVINLLDARALAWAAAAQLTQTLYDGGASKRRIEVATADAGLSDLAYRKAVVEAWRGSQEAGARLQAAYAAWTAMAADLDRARQDAGRVRLRHELGTADGVDILAAEARVDRSALAQNRARLALDQARVALALTRGGAAS